MCHEEIGMVLISRERVDLDLKMTLRSLSSELKFLPTTSDKTHGKSEICDSSSTSGWVFLLGRCAISRASKKQTCITGSTMKSEFVALVAAGKETEWLRNLILEIPIWPKPIALIFIHCDSAVTLAKAIKYTMASLDT
ncbi:hypothetical protein Tco_1199007 [Tanacetum coccineum]